MGKDTKPTKPSSLTQLWTDFKTLQQTVKELRSTVASLKDVLFAQDNWHSKIVKLLGKEIIFSTDPQQSRGGLSGKLLWADRYHIGVEVLVEDSHGNRNIPKEFLYNKGHIVHIREA